jgi:hypothetical protein
MFIFLAKQNLIENCNELIEDESSKAFNEVEHFYGFMMLIWLSKRFFGLFLSIQCKFIQIVTRLCNKHWNTK